MTKNSTKKTNQSVLKKKQNESFNSDWIKSCCLYDNFLEIETSNTSMQPLRKMNQQILIVKSKPVKRKSNTIKKKTSKSSSYDVVTAPNNTLPLSSKSAYEKQLKLNMFGDPDYPETIEYTYNPIDMKQLENIVLNVPGENMTCSSNEPPRIVSHETETETMEDVNNEEQEDAMFDLSNHDRIEFMKKIKQTQSDDVSITDNPFLTDKECYHYVSPESIGAWVKNTGLPCFLCRHMFDHEPIAVPVYNHINYSKSPVIKGNMCSIQCGKQWIIEQNSFYMGYQLTVYNFIIQKKYGIQCQYVEPSPPSSILKHNGGILSIEEYRKLIHPDPNMHVHPKKYANLCVDDRSKTFIEEIPLHCISYFNMWSTVRKYDPSNLFKINYLTMDTTKRNPVIKSMFKNLSIYKEFIQNKNNETEDNEVGKSIAC